jgi:hypothetical protein
MKNSEKAIAGYALETLTEMKEQSQAPMTWAERQKMVHALHQLADLMKPPDVA